MNEISIKDKVKEMCQYFKRPFRKRDLADLFNFIYPKNVINPNTLGRYLSDFIDDGIIKLSEWSKGSNNHYIPVESELKEITLIPFINPNTKSNCQIFHTMINPMELIEISHLHKYMEYDNAFAKNEIHKWYSSISYSNAEASYQYIGSNTVVIQAFYSDLKEINIEIKESKTLPPFLQKLYTIKFPYFTNMERKIFFTLKGEDLLEIYRKMILICRFKHNLNWNQIAETLSNYPQTVTIIIDYIDDIDERRKIVEERLELLNQPESKDMIKFKKEMIDLMDLEIKQIKIINQPEKKDRLEQFDKFIEEKKDQVKKINREIRIIESEKKELLNGV